MHHTRVFKILSHKGFKILPHKDFKIVPHKGFNYTFTYLVTYLDLPLTVSFYSFSSRLTPGCQLVEFWEDWNSDLFEISSFSPKVFLKLLSGARLCIPMSDEKKTYAWCNMRMLCNAWFCTEENVHALNSFHLSFLY